MTNNSTPLPGLRWVDHVAFTVPDLDDATRLFTDLLGAEELYRSTRGPDAALMPEHFAVPEDAHLELRMLRLPPNLNVELFQWWSDDRSTNFPRPSDAGGHHLCFVVDDVDDVIKAIKQHPSIRVLGSRKEVAGDSPVAGNRWVYAQTTWGLVLEFVDRSRVVHPPRFVGPDEWRPNAIPSTSEVPE
ncbi:glyoxalase/bleomycin resistance protein/dioxygenase [Rhodococcus opacus M213]|uniref:Glyoxalase/bleomycin resistance protein/dioxygenase n=1 Tax=Rhodococcus opacus M213 TaxID=1129896 RepID=K8XMJ0_RHOOP|nr:VOC family protein [Rhodococcus opacus]EKT78295.1 glyoxalase/bleomycin resistance protein/dioxygenase [Rhodococcus opacus M213]